MSAMMPFFLPAFVAGLLAFTGLPGGTLLALLAREEVGSPAAGQYFRALRGVLAALIVWSAVGGLAALFPFIGSLWQFALTLGTLLILIGGKRKRRSGQGNWAAAYALWGLLLGLLVMGGVWGPATLTAGLVFLYGLVEAALRPVRDPKAKGLAAAGVAGPDLLFFALFFGGALAALAI